MSSALAMFRKTTSHGDIKKSAQKVADPKKDTVTRLKHLRSVLGRSRFLISCQNLDAVFGQMHRSVSDAWVLRNSSTIYLNYCHCHIFHLKVCNLAKENNKLLINASVYLGLNRNVNFVAFDRSIIRNFLYN